MTEENKKKFRWRGMKKWVMLGTNRIRWWISRKGEIDGRDWSADGSVELTQIYPVTIFMCIYMYYVYITHDDCIDVYTYTFFRELNERHVTCHHYAISLVLFIQYKKFHVMSLWDEIFFYYSFFDSGGRRNVLPLEKKFI